MAARPPRLILVLLAGLTSGCVTAREQEIQPLPSVAAAYLDGKPDELKRHFYVALAQGPRNRVLNDMRLGLASFALGRDELAESLLDDALEGIEAVYGDNETAKAARQLFTKEAAKDFKGEPHERVMAYYYRGLLYMHRGDYDNAHASFKGGMIQDSFAEEEQYRADFALMTYLEGWAAHCGGNASLAAEDYRETHEIRAEIPLPGKDDTVLVLAETGTGPVKYPVEHNGNTQLKFRRGGSAEKVRVSWTATGKESGLHSRDTHQIEDIYFQATTRGGRQFDAILNGKAQFKSTADTVGNAALAGAVVAGTVAAKSDDKQTQRDAAIATGALALIGLAAKITASAVEATPDARYWDNLPDRVMAVTLAVPDSVKRLTVEYFTPGGDPLRSREVEIHRSGRCGLAWSHGRTVTPPNPRAPYSVPLDELYRPVILPAAPSTHTDKPSAHTDKKE
ncbi:MAG: hypothetical protein HY055_12460 [Magnetospirillum sp.]|nr:hypothetical protein [Magnetospirillum sp.]